MYTVFPGFGWADPRCGRCLNFGGDASNRTDGSEGLGTYPGESWALFLTGFMFLWLSG